MPSLNRLQMASLGQVASFIIPVAVASAGAYYLQRHTWPMGRTINVSLPPSLPCPWPMQCACTGLTAACPLLPPFLQKEWYDASEAYLNNMPVHSTGKTVRMNPGSEKVRATCGALHVPRPSALRTAQHRSLRLEARQH